MVERNRCLTLSSTILLVSIFHRQEVAEAATSQQLTLASRYRNCQFNVSNYAASEMMYTGF